MKLRVLVLAFAVASCDESLLPTSLHATPETGGPRVVWDLAARPTPNIPLPNDIATSEDPGTATGRRLNASLLAPTEFERDERAHFDELDGWGTFAPITVGFDAPIDTDTLMALQGAGRLGRDAWPSHGIYVVNLRTGLPVPIDLNGGNYTFNLKNPNSWGEYDPRGGESNLLYETVEEDTNRDGVLDPGEDTDFDGVLDHPNTTSGLLDPSDPTDTYDHMLWFYERETNTLVLRPIVPLDEQTTYAVVVTTRVVGADSDHLPVRSPFDDVVHVSQRGTLAGLPGIFRAHPEVYGDLAATGWDGVAVAWSFTTQSVTQDLVALREGLYGRGPFRRLDAQFPPDVVVARAANDVGSGEAMCDTPVFDGRPYIAPLAAFKAVVANLAPSAFGLSEAATTALLATFDHIDHFVIAFVRVPYYLGDPEQQGPRNVFHVNALTGEGEIGTDVVPMIIAVPKETPTFHPPFPVAIYGHGYTSNHLESLGFAGLLAEQGVASVGFLAQGHGILLDRGQDRLLYAIFLANCLGGTGNAALLDRARDQNGDGLADSGGDFWSSYIFHTRDVIRESVLDEVSVIRALRSFDGTRLAVPGTVPHPRRGAHTPFEDIVFDGDFDQDGRPDLAGDFDADGRVDVGGPANPVYIWGQSLGAALTGTLVGLEPYATVAAPSSGAGGLLDVGLRTTESEVKEAVITRVMGPLFMARPSSGPSNDSACNAGDLSLDEVVVDLNDRRYVEVACLPHELVHEGDVAVVTNFISRETRCAAVGPGGTFRVGVPSSQNDLVEVDVYAGLAAEMDYGTCERRSGAALPLPALAQTTFGSGASSSGGGPMPHTCPNCARYQTTTWSVDDPLVAIAEGLGLRRQSPELRRFMTLAQVALESADPVNWAPHAFLHPLPLVDNHPRNVLVMHSLGDNVVPINGGLVYARAAGVLPFMPADAPEVFADYRAPSLFSTVYGEASPSDVYVSHFVAEGIARLNREPLVPGHPDWLFDVDDLSGGQQRYSTSGGDPPVPPDLGFAPSRLSPPLRWVRESRAMRLHAADDVWTAPLGHTLTTGISGVITFMIEPDGEHGFDTPQPTKTWDEAVYLTNLLGYYFRSGGTDLRYHSDPAGHDCLEQPVPCIYDR